MYGVFLNQCGHKSCLARGFCSFDEAQQWIEENPFEPTDGVFIDKVSQ